MGEAQCRQGPGGLSTKCGIIGRSSRQGVVVFVVVVVGQAGALAVSLRLLLMPRGRGPQPPPPLLAQHLSGFGARVHPIVTGLNRQSLVIFDVTDVGSIALNRGPANHIGDLKKS